MISCETYGNKSDQEISSNDFNLTKSHSKNTEHLTVKNPSFSQKIILSQVPSAINYQSSHIKIDEVDCF